MGSSMLAQSFPLLALVAKLVGSPLPEGHAVTLRAAAALVAVEAALAAEGVEGEELGTWARRLWGWSYWESSWQSDPKGSNDNGSACGTLQVHGPERLLSGATCAAVRKSAVLGYRVGYRLMRELVTTCGSVERALGAYATGQCGGAPQLVRRRCKLLSDPC